MRCLVTGGAGFIGSHIVEALLGRGDSVRVLDNFSSGSRKNLDHALSADPPGSLEILEADLRDSARLAEAVEGVENVFHEAAFVSVPASMDDPQECLDINCRGTSMLLEVCRRAGVRRVVLASSAAVYGDSDELPLSEEAKPRPLSPYAASKLVDELYASLYSRSLGLEVCALRYFNVFGPRQRPDTQYAAAVPIFIDQLQKGRRPTVDGDGRQSRDLIFVGDVVEANLLAAGHSAAPGEVLNVCTGRGTSVLDLLKVLQELLPDAPAHRYGPPRAGDIFESVGSPSRAREVLGFSARISLLEGLKETVKWPQ